MLQNILKSNGTKQLTKTDQQKINGGAGECSSSICYQHGDCCTVTMSSPLGTFTQRGSCLGLQCVPF